jgi:hypothetical protein
MPEREKLFNLMVSDAEREMLTRLAEDDGVSAATVLRTLLRRAHADRYGRPVQAPKQPKKKKSR